MTDYTERYLSEKSLDQVVAACRYAFKELDENDLQEYKNFKLGIREEED